MHKKLVRGFTLIELLVVVAIIGILASIVLVSLNSARAKGRDAKRVSDLQQMGRAIALAETDQDNALETCTGARVDASTCDGPEGVNFANYQDPSSDTPCTVVTAASGAARITASCQYIVSKANGTADATTQNYQICAYLESGSAMLTAGAVRVSNDTGGGVAQGCN